MYNCESNGSYPSSLGTPPVKALSSFKASIRRYPIPGRTSARIKETSQRSAPQSRHRLQEQPNTAAAGTLLFARCSLDGSGQLPAAGLAGQLVAVA